MLNKHAKSSSIEILAQFYLEIICCVDRSLTLILIVFIEPDRCILNKFCIDILVKCVLFRGDWLLDDDRDSLVRFVGFNLIVLP